MNDVAVNFERVHQRILNACRVVNRSDPPTLIAVSKMQPSECIEKVYNHGQRDFGENYVQELLEKSKTLKEKLPGIRFHFIGHLQTNKVKSLLAHVYAIHSVDSLKLLQEINKQAGIAQIQMKIYIQVNIDDEPSKGGFSIQELETVCKKISDCTHVIPSGLMCIPSPDREPKISFSKMKEISKNFGAILGSGLSMGMSHDFEEAIANGSTSIRIGTAIFGARK